MRCHPKSRCLPRLWLFTDPRIDSTLEAAIQRLPARSGIIFRHYHLDPQARLALFRRIVRVSRRRGHCVLLAGSPAQARRWRADGVHGRTGNAAAGKGMIVSIAVHNPAEILLASRAGADLVFLSPVYATRSHPGARPLGAMRFRQLAGLANASVMALGGMTRARAAMLCGRTCHGWAAIDALA